MTRTASNPTCGPAVSPSPSAGARPSPWQACHAIIMHRIWVIGVESIFGGRLWPQRRHSRLSDCDTIPGEPSDTRSEHHVLSAWTTGLWSPSAWL